MATKLEQPLADSGAAGGGGNAEWLAADRVRFVWARILDRVANHGGLIWPGTPPRAR